jgi:predicted phosphodiesterase
MRESFMQIALLSDIHGNDLALEAVLIDIEQRGGADTFWILGDLVAIGHTPIKVLEMLTSLPNAHFIRGNTDRYVCTGARPSPYPEEVKENFDLLPNMLVIEGDFSWTQGAITVSGWYEWLSNLPQEMEQVLPDGTRCLGVHAAPGTDEGHGIQPSMSEHEIKALLSDCEANLICVGHTHRPFVLHIDGWCVINPGSVSNPIGCGGDIRASYAIINADEKGYQVEHRRVDYNQEEVIDALKQIRHPAADLIIRHLRGRVE